MDEGEGVSKSIDRLGYTIAPGTAQLDKIAGSGNRDEEAPADPQNPPELRRIHSRRDRQDDGERLIAIRRRTIGIRDYPFACGEAPGCCVNCRDRDIGPMGIEAGFALESAEVETIPAAGVENHVIGSRSDGLPDRQSLLLRKAPVM